MRYSNSLHQTLATMSPALLTIWLPMWQRDLKALEAQHSQRLTRSQRKALNENIATHVAMIQLIEGLLLDN